MEPKQEVTDYALPLAHELNDLGTAPAFKSGLLLARGTSEGFSDELHQVIELCREIGRRTNQFQKFA